MFHIHVLYSIYDMEVDIKSDYSDNDTFGMQNKI